MTETWEDRAVAALCAVGAQQAGVILPVFLAANSHHYPIVHARHRVWIVLSSRCGLSSVEIGRRFKRDHSAVLAALKRTRARLRVNDEERQQVAEMVAVVPLREQVPDRFPDARALIVVTRGIAEQVEALAHVMATAAQRLLEATDAAEQAIHELDRIERGAA